MKRFDRAMYAFFLLALLADVARAKVPAPVWGDSAGGLILNAAGQIGVGQAGGAVLVRRRLNGAFVPLAGMKRCGLTFSRWAKILAGQRYQSAPVMLAALVSGTGAGFGYPFDSRFESVSPSLAVYEHSGSPAP